jgi:phosphate/sulfate permease
MLLIWISVILLSLLAFLHLIVGVTNDAVNFLNSAIGSRVSSRKVILWVAGSGLMLGTFFSGGMMEVARNGVIYPQSFFLTELLVIFLSVSIVNVILIDSYNTLGFPTSTTIAVIFGLIGGALAMVIFKDTQGLSYTSFINTNRTFLIFAGILVSVFLAFIIGAVVQFVARLIFTFRFKGRFVFLFAVAGALAVTSIIFLIFKKSMAGFLPADDLSLYLPFTGVNLMLFIFTAFFFIFLGLRVLFNIDIPRLVVFFGTFALALSFAANDLVNFIGLPLTGVESFKAFLLSSDTNPDLFQLNFLNNDWLRSHHFNDTVYTTFFVIAGAVMILTMFFSKKLNSVTETEVYLGRQSTGYERFDPSPLSRQLVRQFLKLYGNIDRLIPEPIHRFISSRFNNLDSTKKIEKSDEVVYFDTIRASVNLLVASLLISIGTYLRFPLSTTFVVFMVSMGTSLSDQAWARESAVYRISGVLSILGGWFVTACLAFLGSFILTIIIWWGGWVAALVAFILTILFLWQTTAYHNRKLIQEKTLKQGFYNDAVESIEWLRDAGSEKLRRELLEVSKIYFLILNGLMDENLHQIREGLDKSRFLQQTVKNFKGDLFQAYTKLPEDSQDAGHLFVQALDYLTELSNTLNVMAAPVYTHIENQHKGLTPAQLEDIGALLEEMATFFHFMIHLEKEKRFSDMGDLKQQQIRALDIIEDFRLTQIRRIRAGEGKIKANILFMELLGETKNLLIYSYNLFQALREFHLQSKGSKRGY